MKINSNFFLLICLNIITAPCYSTMSKRYINFTKTETSKKRPQKNIARCDILEKKIQNHPCLAAFFVVAPIAVVIGFKITLQQYLIGK